MGVLLIRASFACVHKGIIFGGRFSLRFVVWTTHLRHSSVDIGYRPHADSSQKINKWSVIVIRRLILIATLKVVMGN